MIKASGIRDDYRKIVEDGGIDYNEKMLRIMRIIIELLLNIRTNQTPEGREKASSSKPSKPEVNE